MKLFALLGSSAILVAAVAHQGQTSLPEPLASDFTKLSGAKSLKVHLSVRVIGEAAKTYTLELAKDNKFKLSSDAGFILSDGTNIYDYKKATNSYSQKPVSPQELSKFRKKNEVFGWEAFLQTKPGSDLATAVPAANQTIQGHDLQVVNVTVKPDNHAATIFIDPSNGVTKGYSLKAGEKEYLILADTVNLDSVPDDEFAFKAPDGAMMAQEAAADGGAAGVLALLNDNCMPCHSADRKRAGIDVSSYEGVMKIVTPGMSDASLLIKSLKGDGVDLMPKGRAPMTSDQIATIAKWIDAGAKNQ